MLKIKFIIIIFFLVLIVQIVGIDEDLFDDLWKNLKPLTSKNFKNQKIGEINAKKEEIVDNNEFYEQQNANKIMIKPENCSEKEIEDITPKILQKIEKKKTLEEQNNYLNIEVKETKIELEQLSEKLFENEFNEEADQNVLSTDQGNSTDDEDYNNMKTKMELVRKFDIMRKEKIVGFKYVKNKRNKIERAIANELGTNQKKINQWKKELKKEIAIIKKSSLSNEQKIEKIEQFEKIKEEFTKKFNLKPNRKIETKIATKLGVLWDRIYRWKWSKFGLTTRKRTIYTDAEKLEYVKRREEMKIRNPMISEKKIAEKFGINRKNLLRWKKQFSTNLL